jgi:hypothetical protein
VPEVGRCLQAVVPEMILVLTVPDSLQQSQRLMIFSFHQYTLRIVNGSHLEGIEYYYYYFALMENTHLSGTECSASLVLRFIILQQYTNFVMLSIHWLTVENIFPLEDRLASH